MQHLKIAVRRLRNTPGVSMLVIVTLALGIGASTATFSAVSGVLYSQLPYPAADHLVSISLQDQRSAAAPRSLVSFDDYTRWHRELRSFDAMAAATWGWEWNAPTLSGHGPARTIQTAAVTDTFFSVLGVRPSLGRTFAATDKREACAVVLSYHFWMTTFDGRPLVGSALTLNQQPCVVVGVMPETFSFYPSETDAWTLITDRFTPAPQSLYVAVFAKRRADVTTPQAEQEVRAVYAATHVATNDAGALQPTISNLRDELTLLAGTGFRATLWLVFGGVGTLLLIACLNVAGLLGAQASAREQEIAVRVALGSGRGRIAREFLSETLLLTAASGIGGILIAAVCIRLLVTRFAIELPVGTDIGLNVPVLMFCLACSIGTALLSVVSQIWRAPVINLAAVFRSHRQGQSPNRQRLARTLVVLQTALAVVLLFASTLLLSSLSRMTDEDLGYRTNVLVIPMGIPASRYGDSAARVDFLSRSAETIGALPGVQNVAFASLAPPRSYAAGASLQIAGRTAPGGSTTKDVVPVTITPSYFDVLGVTLLSGRAFDTHDGLASEQVTIVNQALARSYFPAGDAVGKQIRIVAGAPWRTIVGIVGNEKEGAALGGGSGWLEPPVMFSPAAQNTRGSTLSMLIQAGRSSPSVPQMQQRLAAIDSLVTLGQARSVDERVSRLMAPARFRAMLIAGFAGFALLLVALGIYGMVTEFVGARTHEMGVRLALGALPRQVAWLVVVHAGLCVLGGVIVGAFTTGAAAATISRFLYGVQPVDPFVIGTVSGAIAFAMMLALCRPVITAMRIDPIVALQAE